MMHIHTANVLQTNTDGCALYALIWQQEHFFMHTWTHRHLSITTDITAGVCQDPPTEIRKIVSCVQAMFPKKLLQF